MEDGKRGLVGEGGGGMDVCSRVEERERENSPMVVVVGEGESKRQREGGWMRKGEK